MKKDEEGSPISIPIDGTLDLHGFNPSEISALVEAYLCECRSSGILHGRLIHGKGIGTLLENVQAVLRRIPFVVSFSLGDETSGSWGATLFELSPRKEQHQAQGHHVPTSDSIKLK